MYGLLHYTVTSSGAVALGVTVLNRLIITLVELVLFGVGVVTWRTSGQQAHPPDGQPQTSPIRRFTACAGTSRTSTTSSRR